MPAAFPKRLTLVQNQIQRVRALFTAIDPANPFYARKYSGFSVTKINTMRQFTDGVPFITKAELVEDQKLNPPYGTNLTYPLARYTRMHQTSGTSGFPLRWLDTTESWNWMVGCWEEILRVSSVSAEDRVFFAFSFGPFLGFWLAFEAGARMGCLCLSGGGMSSLARLHSLIANEVTVLCCTPSYAIRLAEVAAEEKLDLASQSKVRLIHVAGEPGGSIPSTREHISRLWNGARVFDHHGMTEVGPVTFECPARPGVLHVMENAYIPEVVNPATRAAVPAGDVGELVLTNLGRVGSPLVRYRSGDLVRTGVDEICACGRSDLALEGGILGRVDDMVVIRGVNVYPSAVEEIVRNCGGITEYQVLVNTQHALAEMQLQIETGNEVEPLAIQRRLENAFETSLSLRVPVTVVPAGTLPRFEMKAKRWVKQ